MLLHGDELGRTQHGNNNVYCQDNELSWMDWELEPWQEELRAFTGRLVELRREHPVFRRRRFLTGDRHRGSDLADILWLTPEGEPMSDQDWDESHRKAVLVFLNGAAISEPDRRGEHVQDDSFLIAYNADGDEQTFVLPDKGYAEAWQVVVDTSEDGPSSAGVLTPGAELRVPDHAVVVLQAVESETDS